MQWHGGKGLLLSQSHYSDAHLKLGEFNPNPSSKIDQLEKSNLPHKVLSHHTRGRAFETQREFVCLFLSERELFCDIVMTEFLETLN